jgi:hypothetical protein
MYRGDSRILTKKGGISKGTIIRGGAVSSVYMYISLTSGRPDPSSFKTPIQIATIMHLKTGLGCIKEESRKSSRTLTNHNGKYNNKGTF